MPVVDIQRRMRSLGKIRMGHKGNRGQPERLSKFRITSPSQGLIEAVAHLYGGTAQPWESAPDGQQWEVYTETDQLPIAIPPAEEPFSQWYELWSGAGCQRRCDGRTATVAQENGMRERACLCDPDNRECKLTTRATVMLPEVPGIGVWALESHGYNAAVEMTGALMLLGHQAAQGVYVEAVLRLEQRSKRVPGQPVSRFVVPVIDTLGVTVGQIMSGAASMPTPEIPARPSGRPALPSGGAELPAQTGMADPEAPAPSGRPSWGSAPEPPSGEEARRGSPEPDNRPVSEGQRKRLFAIAREHGVSRERVKAIVVAVTGQDSTTKITRDQYETVCGLVERGEPAPVAPTGGGRLADPDRGEAPQGPEEKIPGQMGLSAGEAAGEQDAADRGDE